MEGLQDKVKKFDFDTACKDIITRLFLTSNHSSWLEWSVAFQDELRFQITAFGEMTYLPHPDIVLSSFCERLWKNFARDPVPWVFKASQIGDSGRWYDRMSLDVMKDAFVMSHTDMAAALKILSTNAVDYEARRLLEVMGKTYDGICASTPMTLSPRYHQDRLPPLAASVALTQFSVPNVSPFDLKEISAPLAAPTSTPITMTMPRSVRNSFLSSLDTTKTPLGRYVPSLTKEHYELQPRIESDVAAHNGACESTKKRIEDLEAHYGISRAKEEMLGDKIRQVALQMLADDSDRWAEPNRKRLRRSLDSYLNLYSEALSDSTLGREF